MMKKEHTFIGIDVLFILYMMYRRRIGVVGKGFISGGNCASLGTGWTGERDEYGKCIPLTTTLRKLNAKKCREKKYNGILYGGKECAGTVIDENKILKLNSVGCDVLALQQRLNGIELQRDILTPSGVFDCPTQAKLFRIKGVNEITLNGFQPEEQIGVNEIEPTFRKNQKRYMDSV